MPPGSHGMFWSFLLRREGCHQEGTNHNHRNLNRKEVNRDCGNANDFVCLCEPTQGLANPYSTMEPFCTTRRLASLIREQALGEVRRAMHSRTLQEGSGRPRRKKRRTHRPQPRNQGKYLGIGRYRGTKA